MNTNTANEVIVRDSFVNISKTEKVRSIFLAKQIFVSSHSYDIICVADEQEIPFLEVEHQGGTGDLFGKPKEKFLFKKLVYIGFSPNGYHVLKGIPIDDHRKIKGVPKHKRYLFVNIRPDETRFKFRYSEQQQLTIK